MHIRRRRPFHTLALVVGLAGTALIAGHASGQPADDVGGQVSADEGTAQQPDSMPSADELFQRHLAAVGGREKLLEIRAQHVEGTVRQIGGDYFALLSVTNIANDEAPHRVRVVIEPIGQPTIKTLFDGQFGWVELGEGTYDIIVGPRLQNLARDADYLMLPQFEEAFPQRETSDKVEFEGRPMFRAEVTNRYGMTERHWFDAESGLLTITESAQAVAGGSFRPITVIYREYRDFGNGIKYPRLIEQITIEQPEEGEPIQIVMRLTYDSVVTDPDRIDPIRMPDELRREIERIMERQQRERERQQRDGAGSGG